MVKGRLDRGEGAREQAYPCLLERQASFMSVLPLSLALWAEDMIEPHNSGEEEGFVGI